MARKPCIKMIPFLLKLSRVYSSVALKSNVGIRTLFNILDLDSQLREVNFLYGVARL